MIHRKEARVCVVSIAENPESVYYFILFPTLHLVLAVKNINNSDNWA